MFTNNIIALILIVFICIIIRKTYSFENDEQEISNDIMIESPAIDSNPTLNNEYPINNVEIPTFSDHRRSESAEKYFGWARKTHRPVEFLRGKRFWLFAKKDEGGMSVESLPLTNSHQSSLTQGLWRSGIVGRRRR